MQHDAHCFKLGADAVGDDEIARGSCLVAGLDKLLDAADFQSPAGRGDGLGTP